MHLNSMSKQLGVLYKKYEMHVNSMSKQLGVLYKKYEMHLNSMSKQLGLNNWVYYTKSMKCI